LGFEETHGYYIDRADGTGKKLGFISATKRSKNRKSNSVNSFILQILIQKV
jgi:hypothetical protein